MQVLIDAASQEQASVRLDFEAGLDSAAALDDIRERADIGRVAGGQRRIECQ
ncbi:MAG: hypothetical protein V2J55_04275 [Candidatus Competibacteraceae bacterium]|nr:hypothetical protein [Candidatus Competibacteraceae bacterium]